MKMSSRMITWGVVGFLALAFIYWQYTNYAHNSKLNADLGSSHLDAQVAAASELIDKKQFGDVLPTTPPAVHDRVIRALARIAGDTSHADRSKDAVTQLVNLMKDPDEKVRLHAQQQLADLGEAAIDGLVTGLKDGDQHVKKGCVASLDQIGLHVPAPAIKALVTAVQKDKDERPAAIDALVGLAPAPTDEMLKLLADKDKDVRSASARYFGNTALVPGKKQTAGEEPLLKLLADKDVRPAAIRAEGLLADTRALPEIERSLTDPSEVGNRRTAIVALGDMRALSSIPLVIPFLKDLDPDIRSVTVVALHSMPDAGRATIQAAARSSDAAIRRGIAASLQGNSDAGSLGTLTRLLKDPDPPVRKSAAAALGWANNTAGIAPLIAALRDPEPDVAEAAEASLAEIGKPAVPALIAQLNSGAGQSTVTAPALSTAAHAAQAPEVVGQDHASHALSLIGPPAAPSVIQAARTGSLSSRRWALITLGEIRTPDARIALQEIAASGGPDVAWYAKDALRHYQG